MGKHTMQELQMWQALPLSVKIRMTKERIRQWINEYGEDGVYVSFSGGKDSTVLLDLVRQDYPNIEAVFVDTGLEYPEIREFVKTFENVTWIRPKTTFKQVIEKYGYPFISKEVSESVQGARKYLTELQKQESALDRQTDRQTDIPYRYFYDKVTGSGRYKRKVTTPNYTVADEISLAECSRGGYDNKYRKLRGIGEYTKRSNEKPQGWEQSAFGDNAGLADERQGESDSGEYP